MQEEETNFPIVVKSRLVDSLQKFILICIKVLAVLMTLVIMWGVIDVAIMIFDKAIKPPYSLLNIEDILATFGAFLVVLIAIEIFMNIILYLKSNAPHLKLVIATALMAIARKVIVIEYDKTSPHLLYAIGVIIAALGLAFWLVHYTTKNSENKSKDLS